MCASQGLMALFFFAVGMEIKREFIFGALSSLRQAILPCLGALGGMIVPMAICVAINLQVSEGERERPNRVCLRRPCWLERRGASCRILYRRVGKMQDFPRLGAHDERRHPLGDADGWRIFDQLLQQRRSSSSFPLCDHRHGRAGSLTELKS